MTPEEIAQEYCGNTHAGSLVQECAQDIRTLIEAEREACAILAESWAFSAVARGANPANSIAAAIRARK